MNAIRILIELGRQEVALFRQSREDTLWLAAIALGPAIALAVIFALFNEGTM